MPWLRIRWTLASLLCLAVLTGNVYTAFTPVRLKLVRAPRSGETAIPVPLEGVGRLAGSHLVLVCIVRNDGAARLDLSLTANGRALKQVAIAPGATSRIDVAWPRPEPPAEPYQVTLTGTTRTWTLRYLELANLHGFTRGAVEALVLPPGQRFGRPTLWWLAALAAGAMLLASARPARWPRWVRGAWVVVAALVAVVFVAIVLSPWVTPFRIALSLRTFVAGSLVLAAPRLLARGHRLLAALRPSATRMVARLSALPWPFALATVAVGAYAAFLALHVGAYAGGADQSGYLNGARLLALGRVATPVRVVAGIPPADLPRFAYVPLGFRPHGAEEMSPTYPIGLPLAVLATAQLTGWHLAPHVTVVWHAVLGVLLTYWLGRTATLSKSLSSVGALMLATSPLYLFSSTMVMSDTPAMVWGTAAVLLAWRSRDDHLIAALAGAAVAMAVLVRPTGVLVLAPVAACLGASPRRWAWLCGGGAPGAAVLLLHNAAAYGSALETGYGDVGSAFALANVMPSLRNYREWLPVEMTPLVVLALGLPLLWRRSSRLVAVLGLWMVGYLGLYAFYYHTHEAWWYLRFVLPAFPPLGVAALLVGRQLRDVVPGGRSATGRRVLAAAGLGACALALASNVAWSRKLEAADAGRGERAYREAAVWARAHLPAGSALAAVQTSGALFYYTDFPLLRWDHLSREDFAAVAAALERRRQPLYAVLFPFEIEEERALSERLPGTWTRVGAVQHVTIWRFDGPPPGVTSSAAPPRAASGAGTP